MTARRTLQNKRHRSPQYPAITLEAALKRAKSLHSAAEDRAVPFPIAAKTWGYVSGSGLAVQTLSALKQFGLAEAGGRGPQRSLKLTPAALEILTNKSDPECKKLLQQAALRPKIHGELWKFLNEKPTSRREIFEYLVKQRAAGKFNYKRVDKFIDRFRNTMIFAGLCSDFLFAGLEPAIPNGLAIRGENLSGPEPLPSAAAVWEFRVPLDGGRSAVIRLPLPVLADDLERIVAALSTGKPALVPAVSPIPAAVESPPDENSPIPPLLALPSGTGRRERRIMCDPTRLLGDPPPGQ